MSFTYDLETDLGELRLTIADTNSSAYAFEDAELQLFLRKGGSVGSAAILAVTSLLADAARRQRAFQLPGISYDDKGRVDALRGLLAELKEAAPVSVTSVLPRRHPMDRDFEEVS